jgi:hypothetical protein
MTDEVGKQNVVDLNPRPTGTFVLGCLRPHFAGALAMDEACVMPYMGFSASRDSFKTAFGRELRAGEIVILAWFSDPKKSRCFTCLAVGGKNKVLLERLCGSIERWAEDVRY